MIKHPTIIALLCLLTLSLGAATTPPQLLQGTQPPYPEELKETGESGEAKITVQIDATGAVTNAAVKSATHEAFGLAAMEAIKTWRFKPAQEEGKPVPATVVIPIRFKLALKDQINAEAGRKVFVDIDELTEKVHTWADVKRWYNFRGKGANRMPYPEHLKGSGISEEIRIQCIISPEGLPLNPTIVDLETKELAIPAIMHLVEQRFERPKLNGEPIYLQQKVKIICSEDPAFGRKPGK